MIISGVLRRCGLEVTAEIEYVVIRINTGICVSPNTSEY